MLTLLGNTGSGITFLLVLVEDIMILAPNMSEVFETVKILRGLCSVRNSKTPDWFLGVRIDCRRDSSKNYRLITNYNLRTPDAF